MQRAQRALHVGDVGLEVVESVSNARLDLRGVLPRRAVGSNLVQRRRRHIGGFVEAYRCSVVVSLKVEFVNFDGKVDAQARR